MKIQLKAKKEKFASNEYQFIIPLAKTSIFATIDNDSSKNKVTIKNERATIKQTLVFTKNNQCNYTDYFTAFTNETALKLTLQAVYTNFCNSGNLSMLALYNQRYELFKMLHHVDTSTHVKKLKKYAYKVDKYGKKHRYEILPYYDIEYKYDNDFTINSDVALYDIFSNARECIINLCNSGYINSTFDFQFYKACVYKVINNYIYSQKKTINKEISTDNISDGNYTIDKNISYDSKVDYITLIIKKYIDNIPMNSLIDKNRLVSVCTLAMYRYTQEEISELLQVNTRTIQKDYKRLRSLLLEIKKQGLLDNIAI